MIPDSQCIKDHMHLGASDFEGLLKAWYFLYPDQNGQQQDVLHN